jgi:ribosomal protein S18 acetylase RimI-like enzyme
MNGIPDIFKIRLATMDDLDELTRLHCESFKPEEHVPMMLGKNYVRSNYRWQLGDQDTYVLVADSGKKVIGLISVCKGSFFKPMFLAGLGEFMYSILMNPRLIINKQLWQRLIRRSANNNNQAETIAHYPGVAQMIIGAVDSESRGLGVFPSLIMATTYESKRLGSRAIRAGVYKRNLPVQRAFIKAGWEEAPIFETEDTKYYIYFIDPGLRQELGCENQIP